MPPSVLFEYRHDDFSPDWSQIRWSHSIDDLAVELAGDWVEDEDDESEIRRLSEQIEIRNV